MQRFEAVVSVSPECANRPYKCRACSGQALDEDSDQIVDCACTCHREES